MNIWTHRAASPDACLAAFQTVRPANLIAVSFDDDVTVIFFMPASASLAELADRLVREGGSSGRRMRSVVVCSRGISPLARRAWNCDQ